ncbi:MAG: TauD/TfdA family dioxygenase [Hyphomicrobiales bacterium]|nr:TauD/TfdA family dioxygenase [Hyphomicrobiales bacterium]
MAQPVSLATSNASPLKIRRIGAYLGAEVTGVDLSRPLDEAMIKAIGQAHSEHEVLVFPRQKIGSEDLKRFGRYFGELTVHPFSTNAAEAPELIVYDNKEGNPPPPTDIWHTDETFRETPPMGTILCSKIIPEIGGDTCFHSMTAAFDALSDRMQNFISGLEAVHDFKPFKTLFAEDEAGWRKLRHFEEIYRPVVHPVVRVHPMTGKKAIFVNPQFTLFIKGMEERESRVLLDTLFHVTSVLEHQYRHRWEPDMVVFWDNRSTQHAAVHDYYPQRRLMERVTVKGDRPVGPGEPAKASDLRKLKVPPLSQFKDRPLRQFEKN